ncbi:MAG: DUF2804 domain-containing protein [Coprobacillus sp.]|nr:DUF2804 domain-containing protein [Coprobacillus sp.]MDY4145796.1 DUF2804 domain-containing protein [Bacilli bacterium]CCY07982.1 uncharacterized protein BN756_01246 [Coprobacillus sp. CAG:698]
MYQNELKPGKLLDVYGNLSQAGYAKSLVKEYNRNDIKANKLRIKEWDYYYIGNNNYGIALTIADNSYMGLGSVSILDFKAQKFITKSSMTFMPQGKTNMPSSSKEGNVYFNTSKLELSFEKNNNKRFLKGVFRKYNKGIDLHISIELFDEPEESMVIATPFEKKHHFYYNQKINCMRARGKATLGGKTYSFFPEESFAVLDWGRGVWTYKNTWYWSSMSGIKDGKKIGFNLGYGFGNTDKATENMLFFDGKAYKIEAVTFHIPRIGNKYDYLSPWKFSSNDGTVNLTFTPILNRKDYTNILVIKSLQDQVFGKFSGYIMINDKKYEIEDLVGFAERVTNYW